MMSWLLWITFTAYISQLLKTINLCLVNIIVFTAWGDGNLCSFLTACARIGEGWRIEGRDKGERGREGERQARQTFLMPK